MAFEGEASDLLLVLGLLVVAFVALALVLRESRRRRRYAEIVEEAVLPQDDEHLDALCRQAPSVFIAGPEHAPLMTVELLPRRYQGRTEQAPLTPTMRDYLSPLLSHVPRLGVAAAEGTQRTLSIVLSPELQRRIAAGTAEMVGSLEVPGGLRGMVRDASTKKIIGHASLVSGVNPVAIAAAAWQVASVVTAQKYLAEISQKLKVIEAGVQRIERWLRDKLMAEIESDYRHLSRIAGAATHGRLSEGDKAAYGVTLESIERNNAAAMGLLERTIDDFPSSMFGRGTFAWTGGGLKDAVLSMQGEVDSYEELLHAYVLAATVRVTAARMRLVVGMNEAHAREIAADVYREVTAIAERHPSALQTILHKKSSEMWGFFTVESTDKGARAQVRGLVERCGARSPMLEDSAQTGQGLLDDLDEAEQRRGRPLHLVVTIDSSGEPIALERAEG